MEAMLDLVGEIYEASYNPSHWNTVLERLCGEVFGARSGGIFVEDYQSNSRSVLAVHGLPKLTQASYRFGIARYDYAFQAQFDQPPGLARQIIDQAEVKHSQPLYHRLLSLLDLGYIAGMNIYKDDEWFVGIAFHRSFGATPFSEEELYKLKLLYPHFRRAIRIHREFHRLRLREQTLGSALSKLMLGVIVLDSDRQVSYINPVAEAILSNHPAMQITHNRPRATDARDQQEFARLIEVASRARPKDVATGSLAMALKHPERAFPLTVMFSTLSASDAMVPADGAGSVVLYLSDPESPVNIPAEALRSIYGMTNAEASIAVLIANGLTLRDISEINGVSLETVRTQLKSVFTRMGVSKQQELVRVLLSSALHTG